MYRVLFPTAVSTVESGHSAPGGRWAEERAEVRAMISALLINLICQIHQTETGTSSRLIPGRTVAEGTQGRKRKKKKKGFFFWSTCGKPKLGGPVSDIVSRKILIVTKITILFSEN